MQRSSAAAAQPQIVLTCRELWLLLELELGFLESLSPGSPDECFTLFQKLSKSLTRMPPHPLAPVAQSAAYSDHAWRRPLLGLWEAGLCERWAEPASDPGGAEGCHILTPLQV